MGFATGDAISIPVPEPGTFVLGSLGVAGVLVFQRMTRRQRAGI